MIESPCSDHTLHIGADEVRPTSIIRVTPLGNLYEWISECRRSIHSIPSVILDMSGLSDGELENITASTTVELALLNDYLCQRLFTEIPVPWDFHFEVVWPEEHSYLARHLSRLGLTRYFGLAQTRANSFVGEDDHPLASNGWAIVPLTRVDSGLEYIEAIEAGRERLRKILMRRRDVDKFCAYVDRFARTFCDNVIERGFPTNGRTHGYVATQIIGRTKEIEVGGRKQEALAWYDLTLAIGDLGLGVKGKPYSTQFQAITRDAIAGFLNDPKIKPIAEETSLQWQGSIQVSFWDCMMNFGLATRSYVENIYPVPGLRVALTTRLKLLEV